MLRDGGGQGEGGRGRWGAENGHWLAQADTVARTMRLEGPTVGTLRGENWEKNLSLPQHPLHCIDFRCDL